MYELYLATSSCRNLPWINDGTQSNHHMYELYTIVEGDSKFMKAVGITFGLAAVDQNINSKVRNTFCEACFTDLACVLNNEKSTAKVVR